MKTRCKNRRKLSQKYKRHAQRNTIVLCSNNSLAHEMKKAEICYTLKKQGKEFYTEAEFITGRRADIYITDSDLAVEIMHSEEMASLDTKKRFYPCSVVGVLTTEEWNEDKLR